jgi:phage tail sheath protein FI
MEFLSPGVFIEEVASNSQVVQAVGTSTMGIVGWTMQGPVDQATLVTSLDGFTRQFGGFTNDSLVPIEVAAFFANGGTRAYVVRVVPSDADVAINCIAGDVTTTSFASAATGASPFTDTVTSTATPMTPGSVVVSWTKAGTAISLENPVFSPAENGVLLGAFTATLASVPLTNDVLTLHWLESAVAKTATITGTSTLGGANSANLSAASITRSSGALSITFATGHAPDTNSITVDYRPVGSAATVTDDGVGAFTASGVAGTVDYDTGAISVTWTGATVVPYNGSTPSVSYNGCLYGLETTAAGAWGNDIRVTLEGNENTFVYGTTADADAGSYGKFNLLVSQLDSDGNYQLKETFEEIDLVDATDPMFITDVVNESSAYITVSDNGLGLAPGSFVGTHRLAEAVTPSPAVNGTLKAFTATLTHPALVKTSLVLTLTDGGNSSQFVCNAAGNLTTVAGNTAAALDTTKANTINYTTGALVLNFATAPGGSSTLAANYVSMPTTSSVDYDLTGGSDGTVSGLSRTEVSSPALSTDKKGLYALNRIDEMMQVIIPDFAGDTTIAGDQIDYAEARKDAFIILATPAGTSAQEVVDYVRITLNRPTKYAAMYWPWIKVADPLNNNRTLLVPPLAHVAGCIARTDINRNVGKAPAGTVDGALRFLTGLELNPDKGEMNTVYPARVNPLINTPQTGMVIWGSRTLSSDSSWRNINASRLFMFVEKSTFNATHWVIFESISTGLYSRVKTQLDGFLNNLYSQGYFAGRSPAEAYYIVCDRSNNPTSVVDAGQVVVDIGIAPNKPAEFLRLRFAQVSSS